MIEVKATDFGIPQREGFGNVTIKVPISHFPQTYIKIQVLDKNDNEPYFERSLYESEIEETARVGAAVISVSAMDADDEAM